MESCLGKLEVIFIVAQLALFVSAQNCFVAIRKVATPLSNVTYLPNGTQAIITSYKFRCCGNITTWQTYVEPGELVVNSSRITGLYDIAFQVWRPSPTVQENGCYSMVGENSYTSVSIGSGGLVRETPEPTNILTVQPGDVVGYYTIIHRKILNAGIQLVNRHRKHSVWHQIYNDRRSFIVRAPDCPFPIGTETGRSLTFSTNAAPVLTVRVSSFSCPVIYTISPSSSSFSPSMIATTTSVPTQISDTTPQPFQTIAHLISEPTVVLSMSVNPVSIVSPILSVSTSPSIPSTAPDTSSAALSTAVVAIIAVVGSSALLLTLLCMLLLAITLTKVRKMRQINLAETVIDQQQQVNTPMNMNENVACRPTSHGIGERPLTESQLYEPINTASEVEDLYEVM